MKISYKWLQQLIRTDKTPEELSLILTGLGLEVESLEKVESVRGGLQGLLTGLVKETRQHPNADRLKITKVDVGLGEDLQIVCGAPNVAAGQKVIVATVGATVYPSEGDPFTINRSKIRGEFSEGMICAEDEIGLGAGHDGIMVLEPSTPVGIFAREYFKVEDDHVFEIGLTPNRADAASHIGVARDLGAFLQLPVHSPVAAEDIPSADPSIRVRVDDPKGCKRYSSVEIKNISVGESPDWLKRRLQAIGVRPINNVVDVTNFVLHELGQPLHAFDADEIHGGEIIVKRCAEGTPFITLDGVERTLSAEDLMICDQKGPLCIAGIFGGIKSGVSANTRNVFLESAYFDAVSVRKTSKRHALKTDASFRFERGTDPDMTVFALKRAAALITEVAGGEITSAISDIYPQPVKPFLVDILFSNVARLIGKAIDPVEIRAILTGLEIQVLSESAEGMSLAIPPRKVDVTREVDVIEEILRVHGYDNVPIPGKIKASLQYSSKPDPEAVQHLVSDTLSANGFFEFLTNSLTSPVFCSRPDVAVTVLNPLSGDLSVLRQSLLHSLLASVSFNQKRKAGDLKIYEFGKVYRTIENDFQESRRLGILMTGLNGVESWNENPVELNFYDLKSLVDMLTKKLGLTGIRSADISEDDFEYGLAYFWSDRKLVSFGKISNAALKLADVNGEVFYADFDWDAVLRAIRKNKIAYQDVAKFPSVRRDLSLLLDESVSFERLREVAFKTDRNILREINVFDVYTGDKLPAGKKSYALSFLLQDDEKTLTDKQIDGLMQKLIYNFEKQTGASIRK